MTEPSSFLFVTWEGGGNVPAVLGVARRLVARGHRVRVLSEPCLAGAVEAAGAELIAFTKHFTRTRSSEQLLDDYSATNPVAALKRSLGAVMFGPASSVAEETRLALDAEPTAAVIADYMMPGALIAAEAAGVPRVVLWHTPEYLPGPGRPAAGPGFSPRADLIGRTRDTLLNKVLASAVGSFRNSLNSTRTAFGLRPLRDAKDMLGEYHRADRRLIMTAREFDFPIDPAPANVRYVGPILDDPHWASQTSEAFDAEPGGAPLVVVSLSSSFQDQQSALERIVAALGSLVVRGLVTAGPAMAGRLDQAPPNVSVVTAASHTKVLPAAALVVTHAGHGTVMRALANDVPLVCLPMGRDQNDNAAKIAFHGAGLKLSPQATSASIATAISTVLKEPSYRNAAAALGAAVRRAAESEAAVREIEGVVAARPPATVEAATRTDVGIATTPA